MMYLSWKPFAWVCLVLWVAGCAAPESGSSRRAAQAPLFRQLGPAQTQIDFRNRLIERPTPHQTELLYEYFSNGGGVAIGDLNGDGLDDLYFTGNMTYNRLYLNRGDLTFDEVSRAAGVRGRKNTWKTGVTLADVNGDGRLDLYVCYSGDLPLERRVDELYINQGPNAAGVPQFEEQAREYGLANPHSSNQAYFFDYDRDGDLDLFLLTHNVRKTPRRDPEGTETQLREEDPVNGVRFYEQEDGRFTDVTRAVGLQSTSLTYGLGAGISDVNKDGWVDIYMGNDYSPPDFLYINNGDGTFTNEIKARIGHTSRASMGIDVADINNDALSDIVVLDMLAEGNRRQKLLFVPNDRRRFEMMVQSGFHYQYMRNTLQLNNGDGTFSEIGQLAGISNTDWSWTPLIADYNNDGRKDLFVTNGILHDTINRDFMVFKSNYIRRKNYDLTPQDIAYLMKQLPSTKLENYVFRNSGNLQFEDVSNAWGLDQSLISNGAAYGDLDNDGDLDLVTNNINAPAYVFENRAAAQTGNHYLQVKLEGAGANAFGIGAKVTLYAGGETQYLEQMPTRGYLSSVSPVLHFGLGSQDTVDSLRVVWPDGRQQTLTGLAANQQITLRQREARAVDAPPAPQAPVFAAVPSPIDFTHRKEGDIDDFRRQPLMVNAKSFVGPVLTRADVNGDGRADVFVGGGNGQASRLYLQQPDGQFAAAPQPAFAADRASNDVDAAFFDADGDGDIDLYVASGGYGHFAPDDAALQDRLYVNDGSGHFTKAPRALPTMRSSTGAVAPADVNGDGAIDLFVGGYVVPGRYPIAPPSRLLMNNGSGQFAEQAPEEETALQGLGMVSDARWHDLNGDGRDELIVAGAWMPIRVFAPADGALAEVTDRYFDRPYRGLWNALRVADVNQDGHPDLIAGNLGRNTQLKASPKQPAVLYYDDFNADGAVDPLLTFYIEGTRYPYVTLDELRTQMPDIGFRFPSYEAYSTATLDDIFTEAELAEAQKREVSRLETTLFLGREGGGFAPHALPIQAQFAPVFTITPLDYNRDSHTDLLLGGNMSEARIRFGRYDANHGVLLRGDGRGGFAYVPQHESGLQLRDDVRSVLPLGDTWLFGINRGALWAYALSASEAGQLAARDAAK